MEDARALIHNTFKGLRDRSNLEDPGTKAWLAALDQFGAAMTNVYHGSLRSYYAGAIEADAMASEDLLAFLEADPYFFGSGYMKEKALTLLKRRNLKPSFQRRLIDVIVDATRRPQRREFLYYCRAARQIGSEELRDVLRTVQQGGQPSERRKANLILAALQPDWDWRTVRSFRRYCD